MGMLSQDQLQIIKNDFFNVEIQRQSMKYK